MVQRHKLRALINLHPLKEYGQMVVESANVSVLKGVVSAEIVCVVELNQKVE